MKAVLFIGFTLGITTSALAQNTAVISQGGNGSGNRVVINQSGSNNTATVKQGAEAGGQSVSVTQTGNTETHIDQTDGQNNRIIINQTDAAVSAPADTIPAKRQKRKIGRKRSE